PLAGLSVVIFIGLSFLFAGLFSIIFSFQLRKLHRRSKVLSAELKARFDELQEAIREEWSK
ncbi:MAG: hypothetical protein PHX39_09510, partial [Bacteroidales bacterium]|nr:hypothetical protein [Bacteroidales bacterium]